MTTMTSSQAAIGCLVLKVALGTDGKVYQRRIEKQLQNNGVEWTCRRAKAIWNIALLLRSGEQRKAREVLRDNSIAYHKATCIPKGIEGRVVTRFLEAQRPSVVKRLSAALRFYTSFRLPHLSTAQAKKASKAICAPPTPVLKSGKILSDTESWTVGQYWLLESCKRRKRFAKSLSDDPITADERHAEHLKATSKYYHRYKLPVGMRNYPYASMAMSFMTEPWVPKVLDYDVPCFEMREHIRTSEWFQDHEQDFAGEISVIQEQGCKARVVCKPSAWLQLAFMPLHNRLARIADNLFPSESCVKDQEGGAAAVHDHVQRGKTVYCTDLSSATDRFPREFSLGVLRALGYEPYEEALREVCQKQFRCDPAIDPSGAIKYGAGQPMGLYGSFPLFHLSNLLVADAAVEKVRSTRQQQLVTFRDGSCFKVLGDDIVFSDRGVARQYRTVMRNLGVSISEAKSFSGKVTEFAGFLSLDTREGAVTYRPYKVPDGQRIKNPIQFLDAIGAHVNRMPKANRKWWVRQYEDYLVTTGSRNLALDPLVPNEITPYRDTNRGDNRVMVSLCNRISSVCREELPDLSGSTKINRVPLFREQRQFDYYGFDPERLKTDESTYRTEPHRMVAKRLSEDPLMREVKTQKARGIEPTRVITPTAKQRVGTVNHQVEDHAPKRVRKLQMARVVPPRQPLQVVREASKPEVLTTQTRVASMTKSQQSGVRPDEVKHPRKPSPPRAFPPGTVIRSPEEIRAEDEAKLQAFRENGYCGPSL